MFRSAGIDVMGRNARIETADVCAGGVFVVLVGVCVQGDWSVCC